MIIYQRERERESFKYHSSMYACTLELELQNHTPRRKHILERQNPIPIIGTLYLLPTVSETQDCTLTKLHPGYPISYEYLTFGII